MLFRSDHRWDAPRAHLPRRVDLRSQCPPVYNQGPLNSCSANALGAAIWFEARKNDREAAGPSRMFIYYNERSIERHPRCNVPVSLRNGHKTLARLGTCHERQWRYKFGNFSVRPPKGCYQAALGQRVARYARVKRDLRQFRGCLAHGFPFTMGMSVYASFESRGVRETGRVPMPASDERLLGGHAVMVVGYNDKTERFIVRNSWGMRWGIGGYCFLPYEFVLDERRYAWDFWTILGLTDRVIE